MLWRSNEFVVTVRKEPHETHYVISLSGEVLKRLEWRAYSDEDDLWTTACTIEGGKLIQRTTIKGPYHPLIVQEESVHATGLEPANDEATKNLVQAALSKADVKAELGHIARERAEVARIDAIPGARDDLGAGPLVQRAQQALQLRIAKWPMELEGRLLRTLINLSRAKVNADILTAYSRGCLAACGAYGLPPMPTAPAPAHHPELAAELNELVKELESEADAKEFFDAMGDAAAYWSAAAAIRWAAEQLSPGVKP